jgi:hypothetical protein
MALCLLCLIEANQIEQGRKILMRKSIAALTALGIGAGSLYVLNRDRRTRKSKDGSEDQNGSPFAVTSDSPILDDQGSDQAEAADILRGIRDEAFDGSDEKLALALGRPTEEIQSWTSGSGTIDSDVLMKAKGLALQRGIEI